VCVCVGMCVQCYKNSEWNQARGLDFVCTSLGRVYDRPAGNEDRDAQRARKERVRARVEACKDSVLVGSHKKQKYDVDDHEKQKRTGRGRKESTCYYI
jgi:hypothetical protein